MSDNASLFSKVLIYEHDQSALNKILDFCYQNHLLPVRHTSHSTDAVLDKNVIDLGAVFISEIGVFNDLEGLALAQVIQKARPELPIFIRTEKGIGRFANYQWSDLSCTFEIDELDDVKPILNEYLFSRSYPEFLLDGIREITTEALQTTFKKVSVTSSEPYLVHDKIVYGEVLSLIPLESSWCRGYMMLQSDNDKLIDALAMCNEELLGRDATFLDVNDLLNEVTNMAWGGIKSRFFTDYDETLASNLKMQVPIIVNHAHKYITFGSREPQLTFQYDLEFSGVVDLRVTLYQRLIFNMSWSPESCSFAENDVDNLVTSGDLEFF